MTEIEMRPPRTIPEISETKKQAFTEFDPTRHKYLLGCGDDRGLTTESYEAIADEYGVQPEQVRCYGGIFGIARNTAAVLYAHGYGEAVDRFGNFMQLTEFARDALTRIQPNIIPSTHSADSNEGSPTDFSTDRPASVGCLYTAGIKTVTEFNADDNIASAAGDEIHRMDVDDANSLLQGIIAANQQVLGKFFAGDGPAISRADMRALDVPIGILAGAHGSIRGDEVKAVLNFTPDRVSNAVIANEANEPFYCNDVTIIAGLIAEILADYKLDADVLLSTIIEDIAATREALAQHDPADKGLHIHDLIVERYGSYAEAVDYLERTSPNVARVSQAVA